MTATVIPSMAGAPLLTVAVLPMAGMAAGTVAVTGLDMAAAMAAGTSAFQAFTLILVAAGIEKQFH